MRRRPGLAAFALLLASCSSDETRAPNEPNEEITFPEGFLWGSATAAFQIEKGLPNNDWGIWADTPGKIKNGDHPDRGGADALAHIDEDVAILKAINQNSYRFSIEWSRLYPTKESFDLNQPDAGGIAAYDALFAALKAASITPFVTLQHFTIPSYFSDPRMPDEPQGWERPEMIEAFATWCGRVAKRWGGDVEWWATINEPLVAPIAGYVQGAFPPGLTLEIDRALLVGKNSARAHAKCFDAVKANDAQSKVGIVQHVRDVEPEDPNEPADIAAAERVAYVNNTWILDAVVRGDWDDDFDGKLDGPNDKRGDPTLAGRSDYIGINYYSALTASARGLILPVVNASIRQDRLLTDRPKTDFSWDIHPDGLRNCLSDITPYNLPVVITENGIADSNDVNRARFVLEHLFALGKSTKEDGLDVRGYFYWSLLDNFEWASGFCPRFGLYSVDRATAARTQRASANVYAEVSKTNKVSSAQIAAQPKYAEPAYCE
jgi:beta-glucosidase/6-phospho-beta-glucosidase/beta-galactosidase